MASDRLSLAAQSSIRRRRKGHRTLIALVAMGVVNVVVLLAFGYLLNHQRQSDVHRDRREELNDRRFGLIYDGINHLSGQVGGTTIVLTPPTLKTPSTTIPRRPVSSTSTTPPSTARSASRVAPPGTAPSSPSPPASSSTTTTPPPPSSLIPPLHCEVGTSPPTLRCS